jgi:hypothetical protein
LHGNCFAPLQTDATFCQSCTGNLNSFGFAIFWGPRLFLIIVLVGPICINSNQSTGGPHRISKLTANSWLISLLKCGLTIVKGEEFQFSWEFGEENKFASCFGPFLWHSSSF